MSLYSSSNRSPSSFRGPRRDLRPPPHSDPLMEAAAVLILIVGCVPALPALVLGLLLARILGGTGKTGWPCLLLLGCSLAGLVLLWLLHPELRLIAFYTEVGAQVTALHVHWSALAGTMGILCVQGLLLIPAVCFVRLLWMPVSMHDKALSHARQEREKLQRKSLAAKKRLQNKRGIPEDMQGNGVLGIALEGDLLAWIQRGWFFVDTRTLGQHGAIVGGSGSGKTETLLRIAWFARKVLRWQVVYIDAKGDRDAAARFLAAMERAGTTPDRMKMFPAACYDGWRGDRDALLNRLMAIEEYSEDYYKATAQNILALALEAGGSLPRNSHEFLERLNQNRLLELYDGDDAATAYIESIPKKEFFGVLNRYKAVFGQLRGHLDGNWAYEDVDAAYVLLDGLALRTIASGLGRYYVEDFAHYAGFRKAKFQRTLFIFDELSAVDADLTNLFERVRSRGVSVFVSAQSVEGLGYKGLMQKASRMLSAASTIILHRTSDPETLAARGGKGVVTQVGYNYRTSQAGVPLEDGNGTETLRLAEAYRVSPDAVRQLPVGECFVIVNGQAARIAVAQMAVSADREEHYRDQIEQHAVLNPEDVGPPQRPRWLLADDQNTRNALAPWRAQTNRNHDQDDDAGRQHQWFFPPDAEVSPDAKEHQPQLLDDI